MEKLRTSEDREMWENQPRWEVVLSDGTRVIQDDGAEPAWITLRNFLLYSPLKITKMLIGFRDNTIHLPDDAEGYYFRNSVVGSFSGSKSSFIVGVLQDGVCKVKKYEVPEMTLMCSEDRPVEEAGESLIKND